MCNVKRAACSNKPRELSPDSAVPLINSLYITWTTPNDKQSKWLAGEHSGAPWAAKEPDFFFSQETKTAKRSVNIGLTFVICTTV